MNEGALSVDVLQQLSNNPALQRQINPLQKVAELTKEEQSMQGGARKIKEEEDGRKRKKGAMKFENVSAICNIL